MHDLIVPDKVTYDLAYLSGVLAGDGSINIRPKHDYEIKCVGNPIDEKDFYDLVVAPLFKKLFGLKVNARLHDSGTTYGIRIWSKRVVQFFVEKIGLPAGVKYKKLRIPPQLKVSSELTKAYIQGLADTDFSLALKKRYKGRRYYPVIVGTSKSRKLMEEVADFLENLGFSVSKHFDKVQDDRRFGKVTAHVIQLYGHEQLVRWMLLIGFQNPKHLSKFEFWKSANENNSWARTALEMVAGPGFEPGTSSAHVFSTDVSGSRRSAKLMGLAPL
jgi:hypothetical protein